MLEGYMHPAKSMTGGEVPVFVNANCLPSQACGHWSTIGMGDDRIERFHGWVAAMVKKAGREKFRSDLPAQGERTPPKLGADMIAKLQAAVNSAARRRRVQVREVTDIDGEFSADELASVRELKAAIAAARAFPVDEEWPAGYWTALQLKVLRHERRSRAAGQGGARSESDADQT